MSVKLHFVCGAAKKIKQVRVRKLLNINTLRDYLFKQFSQKKLLIPYILYFKKLGVSSLEIPTDLSRLSQITFQIDFHGASLRETTEISTHLFQ